MRELVEVDVIKTVPYVNPAYVKELRQRVKEGVKLLRKHNGPTWDEKIKIESLKLANPRMCVLGQVFKNEAKAAGMGSGYYWGAQSLDIQDSEENYGFSLPYDETYTWEKLNPQDQRYLMSPWSLLGDLWVEAIEASRKKREGKINGR